MKLNKIAYWATTLVVCFLIGYSGFNDLIKAPFIMEGMGHLGYPAYLVPFLGVAKMAAIIVLLIPVKMRIKDWAYAGITIDLVGAAYSHYSLNDPINNIVLPLIGAGLAITSYLLYLKNK
jgi:uncharacterized membrane protein YphA (DoxX/SURF4 family)